MEPIKTIEVNIEIETLRSELNAVRKQLMRIETDREHWFLRWERYHKRLVKARLLLQEYRRMQKNNPAF